MEHEHKIKIGLADDPETGEEIIYRICECGFIEKL